MAEWERTQFTSCATARSRPQREAGAARNKATIANLLEQQAQLALRLADPLAEAVGPFAHVERDLERKIANRNDVIEAAVGANSNVQIFMMARGLDRDVPSRQRSDKENETGR